MNNFTLIGTDNLTLYGNEYLVEGSKGVVVCVHGMCEHSERYHDFALFLNEQGYSVYTYDHRGHGKSIYQNEKLGYLGIDGFNNMIKDLDLIVSYAKERHVNEKIFILGHSMGSFVTQGYIQMYDRVDGVILSGSNYQTSALGMGIFMSKLACFIKGHKADGKMLEKLSFGSFNKSFKPNKTAFDWLSSDEKEVNKYVDDDCCGFTCSNRFYLDFFNGLKEIIKKKNINKVKKELPLLIVSGEKDPVGGNGKGVRKLYEVYRNYLSNVELKLYKNARHEILNEVNKAEVYQDLLKWIQSNEE